MKIGHLTRRTFLAGALLAPLTLRGRALFAQDADRPPIVHTPSGTLRGEQTGGVRVFRGVPFAEPPVGPRRFLPPLPVKPWTGERDATRFGDAAMQTGDGGVPHSEDCLYLNVWAPEGPGPFPVFVWIHGGGFTGGHTATAGHGEEGFAREGVVCVTLAYRLGVFGFLDVEPLLGAAYAGSANNALRDLTTALGWIQANIAAFGGDPARVTVAGESAGGKLTDTLLGVPSARPLFHQAISESGGAERVWATKPEAAAIADGYGQEWQKTGNSLAALLTAPAAELITAQQHFTDHWPKHFALRGVVDGVFLPRLPIETIAKGSVRGKRLLIGTNRDESAVFIGPHPAHDPVASDLANLPLDQFTAIYKRYAEIYPALTDEQRRVRAVTAEEYWVPSVQVADAMVRGGGSAWMYRLDFAETSGNLKGYAFHGLDVGLAWNQPNTGAANAAAEAALAVQMHQAWITFIRGGVPAGPGLPFWPKYSLKERPTLIFDVQSHVDQQPQEAELRLWNHPGSAK